MIHYKFNIGCKVNSMIIAPVQIYFYGIRCLTNKRYNGNKLRELHTNPRSHVRWKRIKYQIDDERKLVLNYSFDFVHALITFLVHFAIRKENGIQSNVDTLFFCCVLV